MRSVLGATRARLAPQRDDERTAVAASGLDVGRVLTERDLVASDDVYFAASGITDGVLLLGGVRYARGGAETTSIGGARPHGDGAHHPRRAPPGPALAISGIPY